MGKEMKFSRKEKVRFVLKEGKKQVNVIVNGITVNTEDLKRKQPVRRP